MRLYLIILLSIIVSSLSSCSNVGSNNDSFASQDYIKISGSEVNSRQYDFEDGHDTQSPVRPDTIGQAYVAPVSLDIPDFKTGNETKSTTLTKVEPGMPVAVAMTIPGVKQTVSAIMTGGKITGTVVLQYKGKSYYTNVDFAEEGGYAFGTRCNTPEQVAAFIELACSEQLTSNDFAPEAIVTEAIR